MTNSADPDQFRSELIWIYTVCKDRVYPGSAGQGLILKVQAKPLYYKDVIVVCMRVAVNFVGDWILILGLCWYIVEKYFYFMRDIKLIL